MSLVIGIDPGLASTGYGVLEEKRSRILHIAHGVINTESSDSMGERLLAIASKLKKILTKYSPDFAAVESIFFAKNIKTAIPVAQARGVILYTISRAGIGFSEYSPLQVKQAIVGKGRAEKCQIQAMLKLILGLNCIPTPDHASDALAIALCHINSAKVLESFSCGRLGMFNSISGELSFKTKDRVFLSNSGVEWDISVSASTSSKLPQPGSACRLFVFLYHREDKMQLFGFSTVEERELFFDLLKVESIGPASAMKILSGVSSEDLSRAIDSGDTGLLSGIPGIGKKTAEKIIFKLRGKISVPREKILYEEIANALSGMGFEIQEARLAVRQAALDLESAGVSDEDLEKELLKEALKRMSKSHG
jgi:crossover junction endodeoxyribonuclease RuvC